MMTKQAYQIRTCWRNKYKSLLSAQAALEIHSERRGIDGRIVYCEECSARHIVE